MTLMLQKGVSKDPGMLPHCLFDQNNMPYIILYIIALNLCFRAKGIGVLGYGETYCSLHQMIQVVFITIKPQKGVWETHGSHFIVSYDQNSIPYILIFAMKLNSF